MLAKIVARGADRADALDRLTRALDATVVLGLTTNLRFLRWLVREPVVRDGQARTNTLDRIWPPDDWKPAGAVPDAAWSAAARALLEAGRPARGDADGFRLNAAPHDPSRQRRARRRSVPLSPGSVRTAGRSSVAGDVVHLDFAGRSPPFRLAPPPDVDRAASAAASHGTGRTELVAPMPGPVLSIGAPAGSTVEAGDAVVTLEAMKMEHAVATPARGPRPRRCSLGRRPGRTAASTLARRRIRLTDGRGTLRAMAEGIRNPTTGETRLPKTRDELMALHRETAPAAQQGGPRQPGARGGDRPARQDRGPDRAPSSGRWTRRSARPARGRPS